MQRQTWVWEPGERLDWTADSLRDLRAQLAELARDKEQTEMLLRDAGIPVANLVLENVPPLTRAQSVIEACARGGQQGFRKLLDAVASQLGDEQAAALRGRFSEGVPVVRDPEPPAPSTSHGADPGATPSNRPPTLVLAGLGGLLAVGLGAWWALNDRAQTTDTGTPAGSVQPPAVAPTTLSTTLHVVDWEGRAVDGTLAGGLEPVALRDGLAALTFPVNSADVALTLAPTGGGRAYAFRFTPVAGTHEVTVPVRCTWSFSPDVHGGDQQRALEDELRRAGCERVAADGLVGAELRVISKTGYDVSTSGEVRIVGPAGVATYPPLATASAGPTPTVSSARAGVAAEQKQQVQAALLKRLTADALRAAILDAYAAYANGRPDCTAEAPCPVGS